MGSRFTAYQWVWMGVTIHKEERRNNTKMSSNILERNRVMSGKESACVEEMVNVHG